MLYVHLTGAGQAAVDTNDHFRVDASAEVQVDFAG